MNSNRRYINFYKTFLFSYLIQFPLTYECSSVEKKVELSCVPELLKVKLCSSKKSDHILVEVVVDKV